MRNLDKLTKQEVYDLPLFPNYSKLLKMIRNEKLISTVKDIEFSLVRNTTTKAVEQNRNRKAFILVRKNKSGLPFLTVVVTTNIDILKNYYAIDIMQVYEIIQPSLDVQRVYRTLLNQRLPIRLIGKKSYLSFCEYFTQMYRGR